MSMGQRIREARLAAGLSQRQLAGQEITRNMLSALENDSANPSVATLLYLSEKLCKPISYFLGEDEPPVPGLREMEQARSAFAAGDYRRCLELTGAVESEAFADERGLLEAMARLELARELIEQERFPYARSVLEGIEKIRSPYCALLERRKQVLLALSTQNPAQRVREIHRIPPEDDVLLLRAEADIAQGNETAAERVLGAVEDTESVQWNYLMGQALLGRQAYDQAAGHLHRAEKELPEQTCPLLEICYRELGDYKMAYYYATKKR